MTIRTTSQWREVIEQQQNSDLDVKAYCQQNSINLKTFYNRRAKLKMNKWGQSRMALS